MNKLFLYHWSQTRNESLNEFVILENVCLCLYSVDVTKNNSCINSSRGTFTNSSKLDPGRPPLEIRENFSLEFKFQAMPEQL
jgi:hypothetical protein